MSEPLRLLRYNTGTDKKAFIEFKDEFNAVIFNSTIVAFSGAAIADLVSVHKNRYIIDPQTHIFQHNTSAIKSKSQKTGNLEVKKSVEKYLDELPNIFKDILIVKDRPVTIPEILSDKFELAEAVYQFQTRFITKFIEKKEYNKYLDFVDARPRPKLLIAPYFMLKNEYSADDTESWLGANKELLSIFSSKHSDPNEIAAQFEIDKKILLRKELCTLVSNTYAENNCKYVFIWIDDFNSFSAKREERKAFYNLLAAFREVGKKPIMAYGGYDSILLCHKEIKNRLYGVAQSIGYGEQREITPVGGGLPVNKYYFYPLHQRLKFSDAAQILQKCGYFNEDVAYQLRTADYYKYICNCDECHQVINTDINNFNHYNESTPFTFKNSGVMRNRPTTDATFIAAKHFLWCKINEWNSIANYPLSEIINELLRNIETYNPNSEDSMKEWCELYGK